MRVDHRACLRCGGCVGVCPKNCLLLDGNVERDEARCDGCGRCVRFCPVGAIAGSDAC